MHRASLAEMEAYLHTLDSHLSRATQVVIIGGAAVAFRWVTTHVTSDVDLWNDPGKEFWAAVAACADLPGAVPISKAGVASPPINFEDRLVDVPIEGLTHLRIVVPEAHDLALMKTVRGEAHDLDAIEDIHRSSPLSLATLIERYHETRSTIIGPEFRFKGGFLSLVARLFGDHEAEALEDCL